MARFSMMTGDDGDASDASDSSSTSSAISDAVESSKLTAAGAVGLAEGNAAFQAGKPNDPTQGPSYSGYSAAEQGMYSTNFITGWLNAQTAANSAASSAAASAAPSGAAAAAAPAAAPAAAAPSGPSATDAESYLTTLSSRFEADNQAFNAIPASFYAGNPKYGDEMNQWQSVYGSWQSFFGSRSTRSPADNMSGGQTYEAQLPAAEAALSEIQNAYGASLAAKPAPAPAPVPVPAPAPAPAPVAPIAPAPRPVPAPAPLPSLPPKPTITQPSANLPVAASAQDAGGGNGALIALGVIVAIGGVLLVTKKK